jgi:class 3 adenylate cyclase
VAGFQAGADDYLTKPLDQAALVARIEAMLRFKSSHDAGWERAAQLEAQAVERAAWEQMLEDQLQDQMANLERMGRLKPFLSPALTEWLLSSGKAERTLMQRRKVTVMCCMLHGLTAFVDTATPEVVFDVLRDYDQVVRPFLSREDLMQWFLGDQLLVVFNAFLPDADTMAGAVQMALSMGQPLEDLRERWRTSGHALDFGIGIAYGDATLGLVDLEGRWDYTVMGTVRHLASRLGEQARGGSILVSQAVWEAIGKHYQGEPAGNLALPGQTTPVPIFQINKVQGRH